MKCTLTDSPKSIPVTRRSVDMLESALSQLAYKEPQWRPTIRTFALQCGLEKTTRLIASLEKTIKDKQLTMNWEE